MNYDPSQHAFECDARHKQWEDEVQEYLKRWPTHCKTCMGYGEIEVNDGNEIDFCPTCIGEDYCPRCQESFSPLRSLCDTCNYCGWMIGEMMGGPVEPECICEEL